MKKNIFILICLLGSILIFNAQAQQKNTVIESKEATVKRKMGFFGELGLKIMGINKLVNETSDDIPGLESDKIITITPSVKGNINLSSKVSINIGIGYRIMGLISEKRDLSNQDFSGIESGIGFRFSFL